jgi:hypothetical protein
VAVEVRDTLARFDGDHDLALIYFNQYRSKTELLDAAKNSWRTLTVTELLELTPEQLQIATAYFDTLDRFRLWVTATEAMPATMEARYDMALGRLKTLSVVALEALGGLPPEPPRRPVPPLWGSLDRD